MRHAGNFNMLELWNGKQDLRFAFFAHGNTSFAIYVMYYSDHIFLGQEDVLHFPRLYQKVDGLDFWLIITDP